ncbi:MAG TPA: hypothetical protein VKF14_12400 [Candidatus Dormibacteraeota bacterium]|nr:hypothetical protein [Candidatus Dormibacteraeota bacterium]
MCREAQNLFVRGTIINGIAEARRRRGELVEAEALIGEGVLCKKALDDRLGLATLLETLAWIGSARGSDVRAATLLGCGHGLRDWMAIPVLAPFVPQTEACEGTTRTALARSRS